MWDVKRRRPQETIAGKPAFNMHLQFTPLESPPSARCAPRALPAAGSRRRPRRERNRGQHHGHRVSGRDLVQLLLDIAAEPPGGEAPCRQSEPDQQSGLAQDADRDLRADRAERHADANLARPPCDDVGHDAVEADHRQQRCRHAQGRRQRRDQPLVDDRLLDQPLECRHADQRQVGIERLHLPAHRGDDALRNALGLDICRQAFDVALQVREEDLRPRRLHGCRCTSRPARGRQSRSASGCRDSSRSRRAGRAGCRRRSSARRTSR